MQAARFAREAARRRKSIKEKESFKNRAKVVANGTTFARRISSLSASGKIYISEYANKI